MEQAFQPLKRALTSSPVLRNPNFDLHFMVHTDASETGLRAFLPKTFNREGYSVLYVSRKLTHAK